MTTSDSAVKAAEYGAQYKKYITMFRKQTDAGRDICISRSRGENYSLLIEVVRSKRL